VIANKQLSYVEVGTCREKAAAAHLHQQPLLPQLFIEEDDVGVGADHPGVKVHDPQALQGLGPGQRHVRLAALKHAGQRDLHTVQSHALVQKTKNKTTIILEPQLINTLLVAKD